MLDTIHGTKKKMINTLGVLRIASGYPPLSLDENNWPWI
jgi:hypothetical protein